MAGEGAHEGEALGSVGAVEWRVVGVAWRHRDGHALGVHQSGRVAVSAVGDGDEETAVHRRERNVVVQELRVLHQHQRVARVQMTDVRVHRRRHLEFGKVEKYGKKMGLIYWNDIFIYALLYRLQFHF